MTVNTRVLQLFMAARPDRHFIQIHRTLRLQVIPSLSELKHAQRHQSAAFIADTATLLVWEDEPTRLLERAEYIQDALMKMSWKPEPAEEGATEKGAKKPFVKIEEYDETTEEESGVEDKPRETVLWQCIYESITFALVIICIGLGWRRVAVEHVVDPNWMRLLFLVVVPAQIWLGLVSILPTLRHRNADERSFSSKPSSVISLRYSALSGRWRRTPNTILEKRPAVFTATLSVLYPMSPSKCPYTRKVSAPSLNPRFVPSSRLFLPTNSREVQPISSSTTMVCS